MTEYSNPNDSSRTPAAWKKLAEQLSALDAGEETILPMEMDMISLVVNGALQGEDIAERYPTFYQKLLENASLRQAFLDTLESLEADRSNKLTPLPEASHSHLDFLTPQRSKPVIEIAEEKNWRATWERTLEQLKAIFFPRELAYRAGAADVEDPWFTLLRDEMTVENITYDVLLDCTLSNETEDSFSTFLNLAVTLGQEAGTAKFPLRANLQWGDYQASLQVTEEGRFRFPDIPLDSVIDPVNAQPRAGFSLSLESAS